MRLAVLLILWISVTGAEARDMPAHDDAVRTKLEICAARSLIAPWALENVSVSDEGDLISVVAPTDALGLARGALNTPYQTKVSLHIGNGGSWDLTTRKNIEDAIDRGYFTLHRAIRLGPEHDWRPFTAYDGPAGHVYLLHERDDEICRAWPDDGLPNPIFNCHAFYGEYTMAFRAPRASFDSVVAIFDRIRLVAAPLMKCLGKKGNLRD